MNAPALAQPSTLIRARGREWVVLPESSPELLLARPLSLIFVSKEPALLPVTIRAFSIYSLSFLMVGYNIYASSFFTALNTFINNFVN